MFSMRKSSSGATRQNKKHVGFRRPVGRPAWDDAIAAIDLPAVIFASISTLESAGIQSSGSSTRSWIGILLNRQLVSECDAGEMAMAGRQRSEATYPCPTMASCFILGGGNVSTIV